MTNMWKEANEFSAITAHWLYQLIVGSQVKMQAVSSGGLKAAVCGPDSVEGARTVGSSPTLRKVFWCSNGSMLLVSEQAMLYVVQKDVLLYFRPALFCLSYKWDKIPLWRVRGCILAFWLFFVSWAKKEEERNTETPSPACLLITT